MYTNTWRINPRRPAESRFDPSRQCQHVVVGVDDQRARRQLHFPDVLNDPTLRNNLIVLGPDPPPGATARSTRWVSTSSARRHPTPLTPITAIRITFHIDEAGDRSAERSVIACPGHPSLSGPGRPAGHRQPAPEREYRPRAATSTCRLNSLLRATSVRGQDVMKSVRSGFKFSA